MALQHHVSEQLCSSLQDVQAPPERPQPPAAPLHPIRTAVSATQAAPLPTSLHANTFTDVLASVAAQWSPPSDDHPGTSAWAAQHELHAAASGIKVEDSGSAHGGQVFYAVGPRPMQGCSPPPMSDLHACMSSSKLACMLLYAPCMPAPAMRLCTMRLQPTADDTSCMRSCRACSRGGRPPHQARRRTFYCLAWRWTPCLTAAAP